MAGPDKFTDDNVSAEAPPVIQKSAVPLAEKTAGRTRFPAGVQENDGTENLRADPKSKQAAITQGKSSPKNDWPAGVSSYKDTL